MFTNFLLGHAKCQRGYRKPAANFGIVCTVDKYYLRMSLTGEMMTPWIVWPRDRVHLSVHFSMYPAFRNWRLISRVMAFFASRDSDPIEFRSWTMQSKHWSFCHYECSNISAWIQQINNFTANLLNTGISSPIFCVHWSALYKNDELVLNKFEYVPAHLGI